MAFDRDTQQGSLINVDVGPLCAGCLGRAGRDIADLAGDYALLGALLARPLTAGVEPRVSGRSPDAPVPLALEVEALQRDIVWTLAVWEPPVCEAAGLAPLSSAPVRDAWAVRATARLLASRVAALAALGPTWGYACGLDAGPVLRDGVFAVGQLCGLHAAAQRMLGVSALTRGLPGWCCWCGAAALSRFDGSDAVRCGACGQCVGYSEYQRSVSLALALEADSEKVGP